MSEKVEDLKDDVSEEASSGKITKETKEAKVEADAAKIDEDAKWRAKFKGTKAEFEEYKLASEKEKKEILSKYESTNKDRQHMQEKLIDAKLEAHAVAAGIKDIELVKLIDKSNLKLNDKGEVEGLAEAVSNFKSRKPDFFGSEKKVSSSTNASVGAGDTKPVSKRAWDIPKEEWKRRGAFRGNFT